MKLTAIFESWHLGDGNYPPLRRGMRVNLSFELTPEQLDKVKLDQPEKFSRLDGAEYAFCATVLKVYGGENSIAVLGMGEFRCYVSSFPKEVPKLREDDRVAGRGRLLLDHFLWVEYLPKYKDAPDLFYQLKVKKISAVRIPESFIHRHERGYSCPCSLSPGEYSAGDIREVEMMEDADFEFYLVDFDSEGTEGETVARTFL